MPNSRRFVAIAGLAMVFAPTIAATDEAQTLKQIMQGLRDSLVQITDGLLTDDFAMITAGAAAIASHPRIPAAQVQLVAAELGPEMASFKQFDTLVHDLSLEINAAAEAQDSEAAIASYQPMIEGCFACHRSYKKRVAAILNETPAP